MPRTYAWRIGEKGIPYVFDIDASVGRNGSNQRLDVLLIQWMLGRWMANDSDPTHQAVIMATDPVKVDGVSGPNTIQGIQALEKLHPAVVKDGRIDPWRGVVTKHPKIQFLNELVGFTGAYNGPVPTGSGPPFPAELIPHLFRP